MAKTYDTESMDIDEILEWSKKMGLTKSKNDEKGEKKQWDTRSLEELLEPRKKEEPKTESNDIITEKISGEIDSIFSNTDAPLPKHTAHGSIQVEKTQVVNVEDIHNKRVEKEQKPTAHDIPISRPHREVLGVPKAATAPKQAAEAKTETAKPITADSKTKIISAENKPTEPKSNTEAITADGKTRVIASGNNPTDAQDKTRVIEPVAQKKKSAIETDKYRERFMNVPVQKIEKTADFETRFANEKHEPFERPGFVSWKNQGVATGDLEPLPTIVPAEKVYDDEKTRITHFKTKPVNTPSVHRVAPIAHDEPSEDVIAGQIKLTGFEEKAVIEKVDEELEERKLKEARKEKVKGFRLFKDLPDFPDDDELDIYSNSDKTPSAANKFDNEPAEEMRGWIDEDDEDDELVESYRHKNRRKSEVVHISDYNDPSDAPAILSMLASKKKKCVISCIVSAVVAALLCVIEISPSSIGFDSFPDIIASLVFCGINALFIIFAAAFSMPTVSNGFKELFAGKPNADTACTLAVLLSLIQAVAGIFFPDSLNGGACLYGALGVFTLLLNNLGKLLIEKRAYSNFTFINEKKATHCIKAIDSENSAFEIGRGLMMGEPDVRYSVPVKFPAKFLELTYKSDPADAMSKKVMPIMAGVAAVFAIVYGIIKKDVFGAISLFCISFILSAPCAAVIATNFPFFRATKSLNKKGGMISGYTAVDDCGKANAVVFDASDIFTKGGCNIVGIKTFHNMRIDEAILDAASVVIEAGGPSAEVFDKVIEGRRELLSPVESLVYEDKLGLSAWIHGRRVLVGNRDLLINHNVEVPPKDSEVNYRHNGRQVMYLAVAGKIAALFVVEYTASVDIGSYLHELEKDCITILVRTSDPNITEDLIAAFFNIDSRSVKVISSVAGTMYKDLKKTPLEQADANILHDGSIVSFLSSVSSAISLSHSVKIPQLVMIITGALSMLLAVLLAMISGISHVTTPAMLALMLVWNVVVIISSMFHRK